MSGEVGAYEVQFSFLKDDNDWRRNAIRLVLARNADSAISVVRGSFPTAEISQVVKRYKGDEILIDPSIQVKKAEEET